MSYQERRSIVNLISTVLITVLYLASMIQRYPNAGAYSPEVFRFWGSFFVILIPVAIVAKIIVYIVFAIINAIITREEEQPITDERDKIIETKSNQVSGYVFAVGFILAMGSLALDIPPTIMFVIILISGLVSEVISEISQFFYYRRGV